MANNLFAKKPLSLLLEEMESEHRLRRVLGPISLISLGIGCIIGSGIFVYTGFVAHDRTGPAIMLSFIIAGIACIFAALCYSEFASLAPVAGSAYTYAYATLGEIFAWIIGWDLLLEYLVGAASVAQSWASYFKDFCSSTLHITLPPMFSNTPFDVNAATGGLAGTGNIIDLPALIIVSIITVILVIGIKESARFNNIMVGFKLLVVLFVIGVGAFYVHPQNWHPFAPFGFSGISMFGKTLFGHSAPGGAPLGALAGAALLFFAYIGFDSVSTHAEEAKNPKKDVPLGIIGSLIICTILYIAVSAVLTGMVKYTDIDIHAPVSRAFMQVGLPWAQSVISFGAFAGMTSVIMVLMLSQSRILLAMARDGLLPKHFFGAIHKKFCTPWKSTILTGVLVGLTASIVPLRVLAELVSIGTLLAFVIVCLAVMIMRCTHPEANRPFRCPWVPFVPICGVLFCLMLMFSLPWHNWIRLFVWLMIGFVIYFGYGRYHSVMAVKRNESSENAMLSEKR